MNSYEKNNPLEMPGNKIENKKIPLEVLDQRNPNFSSQFNLDGFLTDLNILMTDKSLFLDQQSKYGKYFQHATAESNHLSESLRQAKAIRITITNHVIPQHLEPGVNATIVTIDTIIDEKNGRRTVLRFNEDGTYRSGSGTRGIKMREPKELEGAPLITDEQ